MEGVLNEGDVRTILGEVQRFAHVVVLSNVTRPEQPLPRPSMDALVAEAAAAGFIPRAGDAPTGLWTGLDDPLGLTLSVRTLETLAVVNPGIAWSCHVRAMPVWLATRLSQPHVLDDGERVVSLHGVFGLGRDALPRYLAGSQLSEDGRALLKDWLMPQHDGARRLVHAPAGFCAVLSPFFDGVGIRWLQQPIDVLDPTIAGPTLGLDEVDAIALASADGGTLLGPDDSEEARKVFAEALIIESLALVAIGLGCVRHARDMALEQASSRQQGGRSIAEHPAVKSLIGSASSSVRVVDSLLGRMAEGLLDGNRIGEVFAMRAEAHPMLCRGATDALQVFGGSGYMRDLGMEKALRDSQQLRLMGGTPSELVRFVAEWERAR